MSTLVQDRIYQPISRGKWSTEIKHTKKDNVYLQVDNRVYFSAPYQTRIRAMYIFKNFDCFGNKFFKIRCMITIARPNNDDSALVAPFYEWKTYRVNLRTKTCVGQNGWKYYQAESPDTSIKTTEDFKEILIAYARLAEYEIENAESKLFW